MSKRKRIRKISRKISRKMSVKLKIIVEKSQEKYFKKSGNTRKIIEKIPGKM